MYKYTNHNILQAGLPLIKILYCNANGDKSQIIERNLPEAGLQANPNSLDRHCRSSHRRFDYRHSVRRSHRFDHRVDRGRHNPPDSRPR
jgi:hypothetical protein